MPNDIYKFLKENNLTDKNESDFLNEYSDRGKANELYSFFKENELTDKDFNSFYDTYLKKKDLPYGSEISTSPLDIAKEITTPTKTFEFGTQNTQKQPKAVVENLPGDVPEKQKQPSLFGKPIPTAKQFIGDDGIKANKVIENLSNQGNYEMSNKVIEQLPSKNAYATELMGYNYSQLAKQAFTKGQFKEAKEFSDLAKQNLDDAEKLYATTKTVRPSIHKQKAEINLVNGNYLQAYDDADKMAKSYSPSYEFAGKMDSDKLVEEKYAAEHKLFAEQMKYNSLVGLNIPKEELKDQEQSVNKLQMQVDDVDKELRYKEWIPTLRSPEMTVQLASMMGFVFPATVQSISEGIDKVGSGIDLMAKGLTNGNEYGTEEEKSEMFKLGALKTLNGGASIGFGSVMSATPSGAVMNLAFDIPNMLGNPEALSPLMQPVSFVGQKVFGAEKPTTELSEEKWALADLVGMTVLMGALHKVSSGEWRDPKSIEYAKNIIDKIETGKELTKVETEEMYRWVQETPPEIKQKAIDVLVQAKDKYKQTLDEKIQPIISEQPTGKIEVPKEEVKPIETKPVKTTGGEKVEGNDIKIPDEDIKQKQFDIITETNPPKDDIHTAIRSKEEILTPEEAFKDDSETPDWGKKEKDEALALGVVKIYSSKPIENGAFVTPSEMEAKNYAGNGKVYSKEVSVKDVAWIDGLQGQYAKIEKIKTEPTVKVAEPVAETPKTENVAPEALKDVENFIPTKETTFDEWKQNATVVKNIPVSRTRNRAIYELNDKITLIEDEVFPHNFMKEPFTESRLDLQIEATKENKELLKKYNGELDEEFGYTGAGYGLPFFKTTEDAFNFAKEQGKKYSNEEFFKEPPPANDIHVPTKTEAVEPVVEIKKAENVAHEALKDVESTAKALDGAEILNNVKFEKHNNNGITTIYATYDLTRSDTGSKISLQYATHDGINWNTLNGGYDDVPINTYKGKNIAAHIISRAYHEFGYVNPKFQKAVQDLLGKKESPPANDIPATTKAEAVEPVLKAATEKPKGKRQRVSKIDGAKDNLSSDTRAFIGQLNEYPERLMQWETIDNGSKIGGITKGGKARVENLGEGVQFTFYNETTKTSSQYFVRGNPDKMIADVEKYIKSKIDGNKPTATNDRIIDKNTSRSNGGNEKGSLQGENVLRENDVVPFKQLKSVVTESKSLDEAFKKAQEIKDVPAEESKAFREKYDPENNLTQKQAFEKFYNEVKGESNAELGAKTPKVPFDKTIEPPKNIKSGKAKTFSQMSKDFVDGIQKAVRYIKPKRRGMAGSYNPSNGLISMRRSNNMPLLIHEMTHYLDDFYTLFTDSKYDAELSKYWDRGSEPPKGYKDAERYRRNEGFAEFMVDYIMRPDQTKTDSPMLFELYDKTFNKQHKAAIEQLGIDVRTFGGLPALEQIGSNVKQIELEKKTLQKVKDVVKSFTNAETFTTKWLNQYYPAEQLFKKLMKARDVKNLVGRSNFNTVLKTFFGADESFYQKIYKQGMSDKFDKPILDANGKPYTVGELLNTINTRDGAKITDTELLENYTKANNVDTAKRIIEVEDKLRKRQIVEDIKSSDNKLPPESILNQYPEIEKQYATEILDKKNKGASEHNEVRYDFKNQVISGTGGGIFNDYEQAVQALKEFDLMKNTDKELYDQITAFNTRKRKMNSIILDTMVDYELLTRDQANFLTENNIEFTSFKRIRESEPGIEESTMSFGGASPLSSVKDLIKTISGSSLTMEDAVISLLNDYHNAITQGRKNILLRSLTDLADNVRDMYEGQPSILSDLLFEVPKGTKGAFRVVKNGEEKFYKFDKDIEESLNDLTAAGMSFPKIMTFLPSLLKNSVTTAPQFLARNVIRDNIERLMGSTEGDVSMPKITAESKQRYLSGGGGQFGFFAKDRGDYEKILKAAIKDVAMDDRNIFLKTSLFLPKNIGKAYEYLRENSELSTRVVEYNSVYTKLKKRGLSDWDAHLEAVAAGRRLMDFKVSGTYAKVVNQLLPFFNPAIQGTRRFVRRAKDNPGKTAARMMIYGGLFESLQAFIIGEQDEDKQREYFGLSPYRKLLFYNIPVGDRWIIIPKGFTFGMLTSNIGRALDYFYLGDKNAYTSDVITKQVELLNPINPQLFTGTQSALSGIRNNYDAFRDKNIIPYYEKDKDVELREGTKDASAIGKLISYISNTVVKNSSDPRMVDYFIKSTLSYWGDVITQSSNLVSGTGKTSSLSMTGFIKDQSVFSDKNVMWVLDKAKQYELMSDKDFQDLEAIMKKYNNDKDAEIKKTHFNIALRKAQRIREKWSKRDLLYDALKREKDKKEAAKKKQIENE